jgi:glycosyltransferase involved in cell wall biosynthesis
MTSVIKQSIIIGALREEQRIGQSLQELYEYLRKQNLLDSTELVIVVPDGGDKTKEIVLSHKAHFPHFRLVEPGAPLGKGRDIQAGVLQATGALKIFMDADLATPLHHIKRVIEIWNSKKNPIIIGVRNLRTIHHQFSRQLISIIGNFCFLLVSGRYIKDTQCGFKAMSAEAAEICFSRLTRLYWSFDMELLTIAQVHHLKIEQIDIPDWHDVPGGTFRNSIRDSFQFLKDLIQIFRYRVTGTYK